jgi:tetratricopeptide (TPR) repeat protein
MGAKEELQFANSMKVAQNHYEKAALYYAQGRNSDAIKELRKAIELYPSYLEAIQLEEKIYKETNPAKKPVREVIDEAEQPRLNKWRRK